MLRDGLIALGKAMELTFEKEEFFVIAAI